MDLERIHRQALPTLEKLERLRQKYRRRFAIFTPPCLLLPLAAGGAGFYFIRSPFGGMIALVLAAVASAFLWHSQAGRYGKEFKLRYKELIIPELLSGIDRQLRYEAGSGIGADSFVASELYAKSPDRYRTEDLIAGARGKTDLLLAEVHAEDRRTSTDSKGRTKTTYVTIFQGLLLIADFHKHFSGRTFVFPDKAENLLGHFGRHFQKLGGRRNTDLIQLEDPEFEEAFVVHASDRIEARYILSTSMMRRILDMRDRFGRDVRVAFKDSKLFLAVPHSRPYLEPKTGRPATAPDQIRRFHAELHSFLDVIEELDLNTRIWSKR